MIKFEMSKVPSLHGKPRGGRPKNSTKTTLSLLERKSYKLLEKAIDLALKGNVSILVKLLDKILPTLERREAETILNINQQVSKLTDAERRQRLIELISKAKIEDAQPVQLIEGSDNISTDNNNAASAIPDALNENVDNIPADDIYPDSCINDIL